MSKLVPHSTKGRVVALCTLVCVSALLSLLFVRTAEAAPYANPFWTNNSASMESALPYVADLSMSPEGVDVRTGELFWDHFLFRTPGVMNDKVFALRWRSMISGSSQLGNGILPSWETTVNYVVLNQQNPNAPNGHRVDVRRRTGRVDAFMWNGAAYTAPTDVFDTLTKNAQGNYTIIDKWGASFTFDQLGMPSKEDDINLNSWTYSYNASYRVTGMTDDRGKSYSFSSNARGYLTSITDQAGRTWSFTYDANDNLKTITTPATADQTSGIATTLNYDAYNRLTSINDGRGNTVWVFAYVGTTGQIASVTINGNSISYSYGSGFTTRTDRNGGIHEYYYSGNQITKTQMQVNSQPKYTTLYRWNGIYPSNVKLPRGNRIDYTFSSTGNLLGRRHRKQDTSTNDPSDLVHAWTYNSGNFMTGYTDPRGNSWTFTRDTAGNLTGITHPNVSNPVSQSASKTITRNTKGQITRITDEESTQIDFTYFTTGASVDLLQKVEVDPTGLDLETLYTYDTAGNIATRTDPRGNATTLTWDNLRRLTKEQAPSALGYETKYEYDGNGNRTKKEVKNIDKDGNPVSGNEWITTSYTFTNTDDLATIVEEIDASTTRTTTLQYDNNQNRIRVIKPEGNKEKWEYNEKDWVTKHILGETDAKAATEEYEYDQNGNRTGYEDGRDNGTTFTFDLFDRRTKATNALSHYTEWEYDKNGNVTEISKSNSSDTELQRETYYFDTRNRLWKVSALHKNPDTTKSDAVTTIERLKTDQITKVTDPRSKNTTHTFDAAHRKTKTTDPMGNEWSWTLDDNGNPTAWSIKEIDGASSVTHNYEATYDEWNRRETYVEVDRNTPATKYTTNYYYDSRSNLVFLKNAEGNPTRWTFDCLNRMTKRERALAFSPTIDDFTSAQVTEWGYDKNNRLTSHKDDSPNESTWDYDALDRVTKLTYPDNKTVQYVCDDAHNVTQTTDPSGNVVTDTFDALNRNTSRSISLATGFVGTTSETRTFDGVNRMVTNEDNDYKLEFEYETIGFASYVYEETQSYVGMTAYAKTVTKGFDANGNKTSEGYPTGCNLSLTYAYNDINNLTSISDGTNTVASYTWIGLRKKGTTYQNSATRSNTYTGFRNELQSVHHQTSAPATIIRLDYAYNKLHDKTYERYGGSGSSGDAFEYDKIRRLTRAWMGSSNPSSPSSNSYVKKIDYNYDDDGNRTSVVVTPYQQTAATTSYTTNSLNEYTAVGGATWVWDSNGNLTDNGTLKFEYDYKNLIVKVRLKSDSSLVATYRYDALGGRVEKSTADGTERYIRSLVGPASAAMENFSHVVAVFDDSNVWQQNFVWNDEIDGVQMLEQADVLDYDTDGNTTELTRSYYHRNALGSVMEVTDANQATAVSYRYDPYGKVTIMRGGQTQSSDPLGQHWTYTGRFLDEETGLYYYRARYHDSDSGRFVQRDPLGYVAGPMLYAYVEQNPVNYSDPSGLEGHGEPAQAMIINAAEDGSDLGGAGESLEFLEEAAKEARERWRKAVERVEKWREIVATRERTSTAEKVSDVIDWFRRPEEKDDFQEKLKDIGFNENRRQLEIARAELAKAEQERDAEERLWLDLVDRWILKNRESAVGASENPTRR